MNAFVDNILTAARTENGMKALASTNSPLVDLFYKIGSTRGQNLIHFYEKTYAENPKLATMMMLWARDPRQGAGERQHFRNWLKWLSLYHAEVAEMIVEIVPVVGRWDDLLHFWEDSTAEKRAHEHIYSTLAAFGNSEKETSEAVLCAKWMPRQRSKNGKYREHWDRLISGSGTHPTNWRKMIAAIANHSDNLTETKMCLKKWKHIKYSNVPSKAFARYKTAFMRHDNSRFTKFLEDAVSGKEKVNAAAINPHEIIAPLVDSYRNSSLADGIIAQWKNLPDFFKDSDKRFIPVIDVSGSMTSKIFGSSASCMSAAIALGIYCAERNNSDFRNVYVTFSEHPNLVRMNEPTIVEKVKSVMNSDWGYNTNLVKTFDLILDHALKNNVPVNDMPEYLIIFSDMQFDQCSKHDDSAMEMIRRKYKKASYPVPKIVFWNLQASNNVPVSFKEDGTALVSGFSPSLMKSILSDNIENFTPENVMLKTLEDYAEYLLTKM